MLTVIVFLAVGIGVGILADTEGSPSYGPPSARFTASFPAEPQSAIGCPNQTQWKCPPGVTHVFYYRARTKALPQADVQVWLGGSKGLMARVDGTLTTQSDLHEDLHRFYQGDNVIAFRDISCVKPMPEIPSFTCPCSGMRLEANGNAV